MTENSNTEQKIKKPKNINPQLERVTVDDQLKEKLNKLTAEANDNFQGMAQIYKSDIVNLILKFHPDTLSKAELESLRKTHLDVFKCLAWLQSQAKAAKLRGDDETLNELLQKSQDLLKNKDKEPKKSILKKEKVPKQKVLPVSDQSEGPNES